MQHAKKMLFQKKRDTRSMPSLTMVTVARSRPTVANVPPYGRAALSAAAALACALILAVVVAMADQPVAGRAATILIQAQAQPDDPAIARRQRINAARSWGYWLSSVETEGVIAAPHDLMVIDSEVSDSRSFEREHTPEEVARMKRHADGSSRILLAYLSFSEAERYRPYWHPDWDDPAKRPAWLGQANRRWAGNFAVEYWHPEWQQLIFGRPDSYLDRVMAQGFDGVYLDRADAFFDWQKLNPSARADMVTFLTRLAEYARKRNPRFLIVMQNAEELIEDAPVLGAIDGIAKEDLLYGVQRAEEPNKPDDVEWSLQLLQTAQRAGRKVLVVEYLKDPEKIAAAAKRIREEGFVPYFAPRRLNCLNPPAVPTASGNLPDMPCR
jgi:cysteinyl-tRNA synthetase